MSYFGGVSGELRNPEIAERSKNSVLLSLWGVVSHPRSCSKRRDRVCLQQESERVAVGLGRGHGGP